MGTTPPTPRANAVAALGSILNAICDSVKEAGPLGCSPSTVYLALSHFGANERTFELVMGTLVHAERLHFNRATKTYTHPSFASAAPYRMIRNSVACNGLRTYHKINSAGRCVDCGYVLADPVPTVQS